MSETIDRLRQRFLKDPLPIRLGNLAATLGRIASSARESSSPSVVADLLDEAKHLIEWTAADTEAETGAELVQLQRLISLWLCAWPKASTERPQRVLLSVEAKGWSDRVLDASGLIPRN